MRTPVVVGLVLAGLAAGCGGGASDADEARDTARSFVGAIRVRDGARACSYLTENGRTIYTQLGDVPCERGILAARFPPAARIGKPQVKGDVATVPLTAPGGPPVIITLKKQGDTWKVDATG
jgi:hypothetical protein